MQEKRETVKVAEIYIFKIRFQNSFSFELWTPLGIAINWVY